MTDSVPIKTELGVLCGRDCIFLDKVSLPNTNTLILEGGINGNLCSQASSEKEYQYKLTFKGVLAMKMVELESSTYSGKSSFDEVKNSEWLLEVSEGDKFTNEHKHYYVQTYDDVFEVICEKYLFEISDIA